MDITIEDLGPLPGLEDVVASIEPNQASAGTIAKARQLAEAEHLPIPATMGAGDWLGSIIDFIRGRRLVEQLSEETVLLHWFACHVPHEGSAFVSLSAADSRDLSVGLKVFGSGFGKGRGLKVGVTSDTEPRLKCATYAVAVRVLPKIYECDGERSVVAEIVGQAGTRVETLDTCPYCERSPEDLDPFDYTLGDYLDTRDDTVKHKLRMNLQWTDSTSLEGGVDFSGAKVPLKLALNANVSSQAEWEVSYEFAPGFFYQPYHMLDGPSYLPPMWAFKK